MKWAEDKKKHFNTAIISSCIMETILTIVFLITIHSELAYNGFTDALTLISGLIAIYSWEYLPKWFPKVFPNRTFSTGDIYAGMLGLFGGITIYRIIFIVIVMVYTL